MSVSVWRPMRSSVVALSAMAVSVATAGDVRWRAADQANFIRVGTPAEQIVRLAERPTARRVVIEFDRPLEPADRDLLRESGVRLLGYLGDQAYFATLKPRRLDATAVASLPGFVGVSEIDPGWKQHPVILEDAYPDHARGIDPASGQEVAAVLVMFHNDVDLASDGIAAIEQHGGVAISAVGSINTLVAEIPLANIEGLATSDDVQWLEPPLPMLGEMNAENRAITQADTVQSAPYNLDGSGVNVMVYDGGYALQSHGDFGGRLTVRDNAGLSDHATHVAGTIGGDGSGSGGANRGMAPGVIMESYGFQYNGSGIFLYSNPGDLESDYNQAINTYGADISNNSIGTNTETNGFDCAIQGDYGVTSALIDNIVRGSLGAPMRVVWANGNDRQGTRCNVEGYGDYYSTAPPATAKNHITVGALNANNDSMTSFSSWGPVDDGRIKPDISAPGCQSSGDGGVTSTSSSGGYTVKCGTSMAAPTVTGLAALMMEDYRAQFPTLQDPRNSTLKVLLAHNAVDRGNTGPDYEFGYGSVRVQDTIDHMRGGDTAFQEGTVTQSGVAQYEVAVTAGSPLKVTLAWDDAAGTPNVVPALVNDLDLIVRSPSGTRYYPWTLDPFNPSAPAIRTQEDHVNNIEQVVVDNPEGGTWTVEVVGFDVPVGPQPFSIAASPSIATTGITILLPNGSPSQMVPNTASSFDVQVIANGESLAGTPQLVYRYDGGAFNSVSLSSLGGDLYEATLPGAACSDTPEYYISTQGTLSGTITLPADAPTSVFSATVGEETVILDDNFESDLGWTPSNEGATTGDWERGVPVNDAGWAYDPISDSDGSGQCYLTMNQAGNTDVDAGTVRLLSPAMDMSAGGITISYDYYLYLTDGSTDALLVEIGSSPSGPWTAIASHNTDGGTTWRSNSINQADLDAAGVTLGSSMYIRISANDDDPQSITEAGIDAFRVTAFGCSGGGFPDCNNNGTDDADDISGGTSQDCNSNGIPDECETDSDGDGTIDACDGCPNDANKTAPGACGCGTADTDSDGDGTLDCNDGCPNDANKTAPGACGCGTPDTDSDGDGTPDCNDGCPNDANKTAPGDCGCGVADTDSDGDGTADCVDGCPNDANKTAPGDCGCGVADTDSDGDGTPDCNDGCPNDANKTDPGTCGCGVADADTDGDGVLDCNDNCPTNANPGQEDCDGDGTGDACAGEPDCNNNGIPDSCDISSGTSLDIDGNGIPDECVGPTPQLEAGTVSVGAGGTTVSLVNSYVSPVVVCTMQYDANTEPTVVRVSNVTGSSFDMALVHPSGGTPATENVSYLVMEEGTWMIDGVACEAQKYTATLTDHDGSWGGTAQTYGQSYLNPVVVGQVMTSNDPEWSVFWCRGNAQTNPPSATTLFTGKTVCEDSNLVRADEEVGFIVFESGAGTIGGVDFEALLGADTVAGVDNAVPYTYNFGTSFVTAPTVGVMTMAGVDGVNGGWAQFHGSTIATTTQLFLSIDEDVINDTERSHTTEQVGYVMFERDVVYPAVPDCSNDGDCDDGNPCNGVETCDGSGMCQPGPITDCNSNGQDDACDISSGTSTDCNSNGIPDECEADADGDGTIDACDNCPNDANKTDPGTCGCGVSDADSDGDGTPDCNDGCPNDANKTDPGTCGCGVSDADSDGDGTPDCNDGCPTDPNKTDPGACGCGVADTDSDGDGTPDCNDGCPTDPNKTDPGACGCGVADTDSDGDGTPDCNDGCPTDPNKTDPGACGCGVADTDSDGDGVADCNDNCPTNANPGQEDCDGDGVGDACAGEPDCNNNGIPDSCDISSGSSDDLDGNGIPDECEGTQARMETGTAVVGATPLTISLANNYSSAVVVCTIHYEANTIPVVTRVTNVTSGSFDVYLQATDGSSTPVADTVSYMVMEEGTWTIDGVNCEARKYNSSRTDENNSWLGEQQTYGQAYTNPVVYGQVMSTNDADWSVFWSRGSSRQNPASASDIWTGLHVGEDPDNTRASETIGYIVFESGSGTIGGVAYRAALGGDIVRGVTNGPPYAYSYSSAFGSTPQVGIVTMAAMDGGNGGWGQLWGPSPLSAGGLNVVVDEDQANDTERNHTPEQLGYIVFESGLVYP